MESLVEQLRTIPGVIAVALGGSRATVTHRPDSDWDFGLYYQGSIDVQAIRDLGYPGTVVGPGEWGRLVNGGAWLEVDGQRVDLLYRDMDVVDHWLGEAQAGRFERDHVEGYVAGMATYVLAGELALNRVLFGSLPRPGFSAALRQSAPPIWSGSAEFSLGLADTAIDRGDLVSAVALTAKGSIALAQGLLAERGEWALNEKGIVERVGLARVADLMPGACSDDGVRRLLGELRIALSSRDSAAGP